MDTFNSAYTTPPSFPLKEEIYKPKLKTEFEKNYVHIRDTLSRRRKRFTITWEALPNDEYQSILDFLDKNSGSAFYWVNPVDNVTYTVYFPSDTISAEFQFTNTWNVSIILEEL